MPVKEFHAEKIYYPIGEVAEMFGVNISQIRYWSNEFDILKPTTNKKGTRFFKKDDLENLRLIHHLLKERKFTIEGAKKHIKENRSKAFENLEMIQSLEKVKSFLIEIRDKM